MNAASSASQKTFADQRSHEPSMEEILASIRRIIADDHVLPLSRSAPPSGRQAQPEPQQAHTSYDDYDAPQFRPAVRNEPQQAPRPDFRMAMEPAQRIAPEVQARAFEPPPAMHDDLMDEASAALVSPGADSSVSSSFNALATSMMLQNNTMVEDSIREMLRPMLKTWLDDNLPGIVERLVRQEIERMARGRR
jgi:cell pole-organizing protein PopZ